MEITIKPQNVTRFLAVVVLALIAAHVSLQIVTVYLGFGKLFRLAQLFNLDHERSIPTIYSSAALLFCAAVLAVIAQAKHKARAAFVLHWWALAAIFLFLWADEALSFHEELIIPLRNAFHTSGLFFFAWVIPYAGLVLIVGLVFLKFLAHLPPKTRFLFVIAGAIFVSGAIGLELLGGRRVEALGGVGLEHDTLYILTFTSEEVLEMTGVVIFIHALTTYISSHLSGLRITLASQPALPETDHLAGDG